MAVLEQFDSPGKAIFISLICCDKYNKKKYLLWFNFIRQIDKSKWDWVMKYFEKPYYT
jgi:hypothetical protein